MADAVFSIVPVDRSNAALVGDVFRTAYGDSFPVGYVYQPDALLQEISQGDWRRLWRLMGKIAPPGMYRCSKMPPTPICGKPATSW